MPRVTVTIPTYNRRNPLENAIQSAIDQNCDEMIVHVWDNHSTDGTQEFMENLVRTHANVRYTRRSENLGALANYSDALSQVETEFYVGLADDDLLLPGFLERGLSEFDQDPSLGAVVMQTVHVSPEGFETHINPDLRWRYGKMSSVEMMEQWTKFGHFEWSSILFKKAAFDSVGGIDTKIGLAADVDFQMRIFMSYCTKVVSHRAAIINVHDGQSSRSIGLDIIHAQHQIEEKLHKSIDTNPDLRNSWKQLKKRYLMSYLYIAHNARSVRELWCVCRKIWASQKQRKPTVIAGCVIVWILAKSGFYGFLTMLDRRVNTK